MNKKIILVFGTRPEAIKMAPVFFELSKCHDFNVKVCLTGQHREMLQQVINVFGFTVDHNLDVMKEGQDTIDVMAAVQLGLRNFLKREKPDLVLVHGDTTTSMAAALTCFLLNITVGHVEAGLRTNNLRSPFPEEFNRRVTALATSLHFAPTELNQNNLLSEGITEDHIFITGNTVVDALRLTLDRISATPEMDKKISADLASEIDGCSLHEKMILITSHRRENFGNSLQNICLALKKLAEKHFDFKFIYPVHPNPNVVIPVKKILGVVPNVHLISPLSYEHFCFLLNRCYMVLTDSGGVQEEAPSLGKPVLVMRDTTERPEAVESGTVRLVGTSQERIFYEASQLLSDEDAYKRMAKRVNPYGDGFAASKIVNAIKSAL